MSGYVHVRYLLEPLRDVVLHLLAELDLEYLMLRRQDETCAMPNLAGQIP